LDVSSSSPPVIAFYCATFLKPEMLHIYRQITALERVAPVVIAQKRENPERFPFDKLDVVPKPAALHFWRRFWFRQLRDQPWEISSGELRKLINVLEKRNAQLLHIFFGHIAVHLLPLIREWSKSTIVSFHGADALIDMEKPAYRKATREMLGAVRRVFVRSDSLRRAIVDLGCEENKIDVVRTGIPIEEFPLRERNSPASGEWRFVQACRLIEKKGLVTTLHAFTSFLAHYPNAVLTITGAGPLLDNLRMLARKLKIDNRVFFPGFVSQERLRENFYASHIFLHPSETGVDGDQEGIPNSMLEAMSSGLPVFATNHGGIPEAIENGVSGILVPERDHETLARLLLESVQDPRLLERLARAGAKVVADRFNQRTQVRRLEEIYLKIIATAR
jgi:colanic acid/amylovoran biosynthesis glycosyltransferase